jgi:hypothetical protein
MYLLSQNLNQGPCTWMFASISSIMFLVDKIARLIFLVVSFSQEVVSECQDMNWGAFKATLTDALIDHLQPIQVRSYPGICSLIMCSTAALVSTTSKVDRLIWHYNLMMKFYFRLHNQFCVTPALTCTFVDLL